MATVTEAAPARPGMSTFERYLSVWVALCIVAGIGLGAAAPGLFALVASTEIARVNLPVALLVWGRCDSICAGSASPCSSTGR